MSSGTVELVSSPVSIHLPKDDPIPSPKLPPSPQGSSLNLQIDPPMRSDAPLMLIGTQGKSLTAQLNNIIMDILTVDLAVKEVKAKQHQKAKSDGVFLAVVGLLCGFMLIMGCIFLIVDQYTPEAPAEKPNLALTTANSLALIQFLLDQQQEKKVASWALQAGNWLIFLSSLGFIITIVVHGFRRCHEANKAHAKHEKDHGEDTKHKKGALKYLKNALKAAADQDIASHESSFAYPPSTQAPPTTPIRNSLNNSLNESQVQQLQEQPSLDRISPESVQLMIDNKSRYGRAYGAYNPVGHRRNNGGYNKNYYL